MIFEVGADGKTRLFKQAVSSELPQLFPLANCSKPTITEDQENPKLQIRFSRLEQMEKLDYLNKQSAQSYHNYFP